MDARVPPRAAVGEVTALYESHALGLVWLAIILLDDRGAAEDVVQEAFLGLYRHWGSLSDTSNALAYVRSSVLNGCRTALRRRCRHDGTVLAEPALESAEASALVGEEREGS